MNEDDVFFFFRWLETWRFFFSSPSLNSVFATFIEVDKGEASTAVKMCIHDLSRQWKL